MQRKISGICGFGVFLTLFAAGAANHDNSLLARNPIIDAPLHAAADPSAHLWSDGKVYIYCTYGGGDWNVFSSSDLKTWTDNGKAFSLADTSWAKQRAWAPDALENNGKYYFLYPASYADQPGMHTGVAVSDSPVGPFQEALGKPLLENAHDPAVFKDDNGKCYLYAQRKVVRLNDDMISLAEPAREVQLQGHDLPAKYEAVWVFKRNNLYYWTCAENFNELAYYTGDAPYGPFTYRGKIMASWGQGNNHHSVLQFRDKWILFYHVWYRAQQGRSYRRICAEYLEFNDDGAIKQVQPTAAGISADNEEALGQLPPEWRIPFVRNLTSWGKSVAPDKVLPEYPRPQMARPDWRNLNGLWQFQPARESDPAPLGQTLAGEILVPFPWESALSGVQRYLPSFRAWYRRTFTVPADWRGKRILLNFGAVDWEAEVFVNGKTAGLHRGGYDPFSFDVTPYLKADGDQELIVRVYDPTDAAKIAKGKQTNDRFYHPQRYSYSPSSGIWQTVWLEPVAEAHVADLKMVPDIQTGSLSLTVIPSSTQADLTVEAVALDGDQTVGRVGGAAGQELRLSVAHPKLWTPFSPQLYDLRIRLKKAGQTVDAVTSYFGLRKISLGVQNGATKIFLNDKSLFQMGPLDQGYWPDGIYTAPTDAALRWDIETAKQFGYNMIRKHVKVEPQRWYYWCDKLGVLVWQDMPHAAGGKNAQEAAQFEHELDRLVQTHWNHPSIVLWVVFNESWGIYDPTRITNHVMALDPSRLVTCNTGGGGRGNYEGSSQDVGHIRDCHHYRPPACPPPHPAQALANGEYGAIGYNLENHLWDVDGPWVHNSYAGFDAATDEYERFSKMVRAFRDEQGMSAAVYTQWTDLENEMNGIYTYDRAVIKLDKKRVTQANLSAYQDDVPAFLAP